LAVGRYMIAPPRPWARPQFESLREPPEMPKKEVFGFYTEVGSFPRLKPTFINSTKF
jgi:hypothetical protein